MVGLTCLSGCWCEQENTSWAKFQQGFDACYSSTGRYVVKSIEYCKDAKGTGGCGDWIAGVCNLWRTGGDVQNTWASVMGNMCAANACPDVLVLVLPRRPRQRPVVLDPAACALWPALPPRVCPSFVTAPTRGGAVTASIITRGPSAYGAGLACLCGCSHGQNDMASVAQPGHFNGAPPPPQLALRILVES